MDEQRIRDIVREELAELNRTIQPVIYLTLFAPSSVCNAYAVTDRFGVKHRLFQFQIRFYEQVIRDLV